MRILVEATVNFKPLSGGIAEFTHQIAKSLSISDDHSVKILTRKFEGNDIKNLKTTYSIDRRQFVDDKFKVSRLLTSLSNLSSSIDDWSPELIISNFLSLESQIGYFLAQQHDLPFCLILHGQELNRKFLNCFQTGHSKKWFRTLINHLFVLRGADKLLCNSNFTANLAEKWGASGSQIEVIHPVFDSIKSKVSDSVNETLKPAESKFKNKTILFSLCTLRPRKGIDKVIRSLHQIKNKLQNFHYLIAGSGRQMDSLKQMVSKYDLDSDVTFLGFISESEKEIYFDMADIFLMPARELENGSVEGFGIVFLEAGYYKTPVIGGRSGGIPDAVDHKNTGLLVNPNETGEIGQAIVDLARNPELANSCGQRGKKRVQENFTINTLRRRLEKILDPLVH